MTKAAALFRAVSIRSPDIARDLFVILYDPPNKVLLLASRVLTGNKIINGTHHKPSGNVQCGMTNLYGEHSSVYF